MDIKPIETYYNGYKFRSRLEARWAVLFDALGIEYEYESEGYEFPNGKRYLPDFVLHGGGERCPDPLYVEVKGQMTKDDAEKIRAFAGMCPKYDYVKSCESCEYCHDNECGYGIDIGWYDDRLVPKHYAFEMGKPIYIVNNIPSSIFDIENGVDKDNLGTPYFNFQTVDGDYFGAVIGAQKGGGWGLFGADNSYWMGMDIEATKAAYEKARQARFEYGETPIIKSNGRGLHTEEEIDFQEEFKKWYAERKAK